MRKFIWQIATGPPSTALTNNTQRRRDTPCLGIALGSQIFPPDAFDAPAARSTGATMRDRRFA